MATLLLDLPTGDRRRFDESPVRFGRHPNLELPLVDPATAHASPEMSRHVGTLRWMEGTWWVESPSNGRGVLELLGIDDVATPVPPGGAVKLPRVGVLMVPPRGFPIRFRVEGGELDSTPVVPLGGDATRLPVALTPRQVDILVALAEPELGQHPTLVRRHLAEIGMLWGVKTGTVDSALREVRRRMVGAGLLDAVDGGKQGINDTVARVAVRTCLVSRADLQWANLHGEDGPRAAANGPRFQRGSDG